MRSFKFYIFLNLAIDTCEEWFFNTRVNRQFFEAIIINLFTKKITTFHSKLGSLGLQIPF